MDKVPLTKADMRERGLMTTLSRSWNVEYYEQDGQIFCKRGPKTGAYSEILVLRLGVPPFGGGGVQLFWDRAV